MTETTPEAFATASPEADVIRQLKMSAMNMTGWLKFLGVINIIQGAMAALTIVGVIVAWLPIWLGVLLFQAGNRASSAQYTNNPRELVMMMDKLKMYFVIQGILFIAIIAFIVMGLVFMSSSIFSVLSQIGDLNY